VRAESEPASWQTKPTDRFILKWIKLRLASRVTERLVGLPWISPWMITLGASLLGVTAGLAFALGAGFIAGVLAMVSQVLDGVDGQYARITGRDGPAGAFLDSVMDRYTDVALVMGLTMYLIRLPLSIPVWFLLVLGFLAVSGTGLVSYSTARAELLGLSMGTPTLASKGTRTAVTALSGVATPLWAQAPAVALFYLVLHANGVVLWRILRAYGQCREGRKDE